MLMSAFDMLNRIRKQQLSDFNFQDDAEKIRNRKKWKDNREEFLEDKQTCEWCGEVPENNFDVHHTWNKSFNRQWSKASDEAFVSSDAYRPELTDNREECPSCGMKDYYSRKTKTPKHRCNNCSEEFKEPKIVDGGEAITDDDYDDKPYADYEYYEAKAEWTENNSEEVKENFQERYESLLEEYASLRRDQVVAICSKCHYKEEQTRKRLCESCEENWYDPKRGSDNMCWDCIIDEKGLEKCPNCDDNWYQPSKYDGCKDCRS